MIQLRRRSVNITPYWAGRAADFDGLFDFDRDGTYEWKSHPLVGFPFMLRCVTQSDYSDCNAVWVVAVLRRVSGTFVPACRSFPDVYRTERSSNVQTDDLVRRTLIAAQSGDFTEAWSRFETLENYLAKERRPDVWKIEEQYAKTNLVPDLKLWLEVAERMQAWGCPASAAHALLSGDLESPFLEGWLP